MRFIILVIIVVTSTTIIVVDVVVIVIIFQSTHLITEQLILVEPRVGLLSASNKGILMKDF